MTLYSENVVFSRNAFDLRADVEGEEKIMTIDKDEFKTQYLAFLRDIEMLAVKLERSDFRIYRPFGDFKSRLEKRDSFDENRLRFMNWCTEYENDIRRKIHAVSEYALVVDVDNCWDVYMISKLAHVPVDEWFNVLAHECLEYFDIDVHFGTVGSPLKFNDFVNSFSEDELKTLYWVIQHGRVGIQEYVLPELDDLIVRCHQLDLQSKSEDTFERCVQAVFNK